MPADGRKRKVMENEGKRLNKFIADAGVCSRREADRLIEEGRVQIRRKARKGEAENEPRRASLGDRVFPNDTVYVNGEPLPHKEAERVYLMYNKPAGVICTADPSVEDNVIDAIGFDKRVTYAGRLDKDSEGLLILTNDGDLIDRVMRAGNRHEKEYVVSVNKLVTQDFLEKMAGGVKILLDDDASIREAEKKSGGKETKGLFVTTRPCYVRQLGEKKFSIVLTQGYNRQIRRMCRALGYGVNAIRRVRIMNLTLGDLKQGEYRFLTRTEVAELEHDLERPEKSTRTGMYLGGRGEKLHTSEEGRGGHSGRPHTSGDRRRGGTHEDRPKRQHTDDKRQGGSYDSRQKHTHASDDSRRRGGSFEPRGKSAGAYSEKKKSSFGSRKRLEEGRKRNGGERRGGSNGGRSNIRK